jgi:hypothetical protein
VSKLQILIGIVLAVFGFESAYAIYHYGYVGFFQEIMKSYAAQLAVFDLVIALSLVTVWMWNDARARGTSFWPYAALTLAFGSVGPLLYLFRREGARHAAASGRARVAQPA